MRYTIGNDGDRTVYICTECLARVIKMDVNALNTAFVVNLAMVKDSSYLGRGYALNGAKFVPFIKEANGGILPRKEAKS